MPYTLSCDSCSSTVDAANIVDLISIHTGRDGRLLCPKCRTPSASILQVSTLQEGGEPWSRRVFAVLPLTHYGEYSPYVLLSRDVGTSAEGVQFCYYKDSRPSGGLLKHGHGPGGVPVFGKSDLLVALRMLGNLGFVSADDLRSVAEELSTAH